MKKTLMILTASVALLIGAASGEPQYHDDYAGPAVEPPPLTGPEVRLKYEDATGGVIRVAKDRIEKYLRCQGTVRWAVNRTDDEVVIVGTCIGEKSKPEVEP